jgi:hypothetical protein
VVVTKAEVVEVGEVEAEEAEGDFVAEAVMAEVVEGHLADAVEVTIHIELHEKCRFTT